MGKAEKVNTSAIANDLQMALDNSDLKSTYQLLKLINGLLKIRNPSAYKELIASENLTQNIEKGSEKLQEWRKSLSIGDTVDVFAESEGVSYQARILAIKEENGITLADIHFLKWSSKFDITIELYSDNVGPLESFTKPKKVPVKKQKITSEIMVIEDGLNGEGVENMNHENGENNENVMKNRYGRKLKILELPKQEKRKPMKTDTKNSKKQKLSETDKIEDKNDWLCGICNEFETLEGSDLILCDGPCHRSFHISCLNEKGKNNTKRGNKSKNDENEMNNGELEVEVEDPWLCVNCVEGVHPCFVCKIEGKDIKEVNKCSVPNCGKYYHRACLEDPYATFPNLGITETKRDYKNPKTGKIEKIDSFSFRCTLHQCDTCFEFYGNVASNDLNPCILCPRAFHTNCIPPGARYNSVCVLCPLHENEPLPSQDITTLRRSKKTENSTLVTAEKNAAGVVPLFFEQLAIPETIPEENNVLDHHFKLPKHIKEDVESNPVTYSKIRGNDYETLPGGISAAQTSFVPEVCCECTEKCDENCFNRLLSIECCETKGYSICALGKKDCGNRVLQQKKYAESEIFREGFMGFGLRAKSYTPKNTLVIEYIGEIIDQTETHRRMEEQRILSPHDKNFYIMWLDNGIFVDGKLKGNDSRYINHSCDPNCELQRWVVNGLMRIGIFAIRDIQAGEPFSYDYQFDTNEDDVFKCFCGSKNCRGTMAPKKKERTFLNMDIKDYEGKTTEEKLEILKSPTAPRVERAKLALIGKNLEQKNLIASNSEDEWSRSYTGRFLPGDPINEIRTGFFKPSFKVAREGHICLIRNVAKGETLRFNLLKRKEVLQKKSAIIFIIMFI